MDLIGTRLVETYTVDEEIQFLDLVGAQGYHKAVGITGALWITMLLLGRTDRRSSQGSYGCV